MTPFHRLESALRSAWLPLALLLLALSTVFIFGGDRGRFYRPKEHDGVSSQHLAIALNLSPEHGFQRFYRWFVDDDGAVRYTPYNRFPPGGYASMKLAALPFGERPSAQLYAVRILMLLFFTATAVLAYLSLCRLTSNRWIALTAALLAFSSYYLLYFNDMTANEGMPDLFGVMLTFHGMVVFVQEGRFRQLLVKTCIALLLGWHVLALLLPFVIIGLASDLWQARSAAAASTFVLWSRRIASALLRSRYLQLGAAALGFSLCVLTFNFTMEYIALDGETPLRELPSVQSVVKRIRVDNTFNAEFAPYRAWSPFLEEQFRSIVRMFIPYSLLGSLGYRDDGTQDPLWLSDPQGVVLDVVLGVVLSAACLIGSMFVRYRILFVTLASFGFFWALPFRHTTALHDFERIYYIGIPLAFFAIVLLLARRLTNRDAVIATAAVAALLLFAVSSFQMSRIGYSAEVARIARVAEQDVSAMREVTARELVTVLHVGGNYEYFSAWNTVLNYYLRSSAVHYAYLPAASGGFVVMRERIDTDALLTPQNQYLFLYDRDGLEAWYGAAYRTAASTDPLAREDFDVYFDDRTVYYIKEPCELGTDTDARFFLHVYPIDKNDLPDHRREYGFDNFDFYFDERGLLFGDKCLARFVLPEYAISRINTGRVGQAWGAVHYLHPPKLILESQSIASNEPAVRSEFDLYFDGGNLYYIREPCVLADAVARFFLHIIPEDVNDLPDHRREHEFDNLDFDFGVRGARFGGKCAAAVPLPQYGIARIITGQFDRDGRIWQVRFAPDARE